MPTRVAMMASTTSSTIKVKAHGKRRATVDEVFIPRQMVPPGIGPNPRRKRNRQESGGVRKSNGDSSFRAHARPSFIQFAKVRFNRLDIEIRTVGIRLVEKFVEPKKVPLYFRTNVALPKVP